MYDSPEIIELYSGESGDRACGDPSLFDPCNAYCTPVPYYCVFIRTYINGCEAVYAYCMPVTLFN